MSSLWVSSMSGSRIISTMVLERSVATKMTEEEWVEVVAIDANVKIDADANDTNESWTYFTIVCIGTNTPLRILVGW